MKRRRLLLAAAAALAVGCSPARSAAAPAPIAPPRQQWPRYVLDADPAVRAAYAFAVADRVVLKWIPCYCGCGDLGHGSNRDCFVRETKPDGTAELDPHGAACGVCVGIALESRDLAAAGKSIREIRLAIDARWSPAGPATPTPLP